MASLPKKASTTGNPTKEVLPNPAVRIKQPTVLLSQENIFPKSGKIERASRKMIQGTRNKEAREPSQLIRGILSKAIAGSGT